MEQPSQRHVAEAAFDAQGRVYALEMLLVQLISNFPREALKPIASAYAQIAESSNAAALPTSMPEAARLSIERNMARMLELLQDLAKG